MIIQNIHGMLHETSTPYRGWINSFFCSDDKKNDDYPVDFVVTWVNGADKEWKREKEKYLKLEGISAPIDDLERYRDWNIFKYWFRAVENYAPWVNRIFLVTCGHLPDWLSEESEKLIVVKHEDFMLPEYLPTFSSIPIELNIWRIPELSEHFVYFNDDMYLAKATRSNDFFCGGYPLYSAVAIPILNYSNMNMHYHQQFGDISIINKYFNIRKCMIERPEKWFSHKYQGDIKYNKRAFEDGYLTGMYFSHLGVPYRKSTCEAVWTSLYKELDASSRNKFRTPTDVMHQIFQLWEMCEGDFEPVERDHYGNPPVSLIEHLSKIEKDFKNHTKMMICVNDHEGINDQLFHVLSLKLKDMFEELFPEKSSFEK